MKQKNQDKDKKKITITKRVIITVIILFAVLAVLYIVLDLVLEKLRSSAEVNKSFVTRRDDVYYYVADFSEDIMSDIVYLEKNRSFYYSEYGITSQYDTLSDDMPECAKLFYKYFDTLITGNVKEHLLLFSDDFFKHMKLSGAFTAQKIYDMRVTLDDRIYDEEKNYYKEYFKVEYKIMENNGTYRADLQSNENIPMEFEVYRYENGAVINGIYGIKTVAN